MVLHSKRCLVAASGSKLRDPNGPPAGRACISTWELSLPYLRDNFHKKLNLKFKAIVQKEAKDCKYKILMIWKDIVQQAGCLLALLTS